MTTSNKKQKELNDYFKGKIDFGLKERDILSERFKKANEGSMTPYKTYAALGCLTFDEFRTIYHFLQNIYENIVDLDNDITTKTQKLETLIQEINEKSGANIAKVNTDIDDLRKTIKEPMYQRIDQFIQTVKEVQDKRNQAAKDYVQ